MIRRLPLLPTVVVAAAVALMVGLGVWQLQRAKWKEGLLARYAKAEKLPPIIWPTVPLKDAELPLFRHATGMCVKPVGQRAQAGENRSGEPGYVHILDCATGVEGPGMAVEVGWS
jgi:cytochrome oxidase assembly protein ShyY1